MKSGSFYSGLNGMLRLLRSSLRVHRKYLQGRQRLCIATSAFSSSVKRMFESHDSISICLAEVAEETYSGRDCAKQRLIQVKVAQVPALARARSGSHWRRTPVLDPITAPQMR